MYPELKTVKELLLGGGYKRVPICEEILSDRFTTIEVMRTLRAASDHCYLLESAGQQEVWGRYSFLGYEPTAEITCKDGELTVRTLAEDGSASVTKEHTDHPGDVLRRLIADNKSPIIEGLPSFTGGLVGYFSYDYVRYCEPKLKRNPSDGGNTDGADDFNDMDLMLFDEVIVFDHYRQRLCLVAGVKPDDVSDEADIERAYTKATERIGEIKELIENGAKKEFKPLRLKSTLAPLFDKERFVDIVEKAKHYIREGDIFQVVLSNPLYAEAEGSLFDTYRVLRAANPSPYMFYFSSDNIELSGASPETLVKLKDGIGTTFPLAGTRPRGKDSAEDDRLKKELLADEKERAEHNMLVDLGRNDMGKISRLGTVKVDSYMDILKFSHVMHIGSTVSGELSEDKDAVDAIDAILPAGTLSGAPKFRACQIIDELEGNKRGVYGGAIGYLDFAGNLDTCIAIRLVYKRNGRICIRSGAGIVADSVPEREYEECANKARAVVAAIENSGEVRS